MITTDQIKIIQTLLNKRFSDRTERLEFLSDFFGMEIKSTKDLTEKQAFQLIRFLKEGRVAPASYYARFDADNNQHLTILARCHELGWVVSHDGRIIADLNKLGGWLISKRSPVKKALMDMSHKELSKVIFAIENMIKSKYK
ncbi:hypothetical protein [Capnocytophaga catalasegens]|uniref:DUF1018 domain-containing protein n=1 Tax=Capnocytophaga catalasegens TaxID=1004260 RepID=A0AAV5B025_9FLAO|nr:hypothetical protein [Capnocytophaga catalasegens]GIZ15282.1 hypothetical protein RCZ03_12820 [Capnocytophaga catalasegens]GJM51216.1 hypothetical protein RCZ15_21890 [Capnocytophaga catalasegens]GJM53010.1 hypothetical protein RCZ16_13270 [Capnocytophaga catalasegens]